jgi:hypothetical protein
MARQHPVKNKQSSKARRRRSPSGGARDARIIVPIIRAPSPVLIIPVINNAPVLGGTPVRGPNHTHGTRFSSRNVVAPSFPSEGTENGITVKI